MPALLDNPVQPYPWGSTTVLPDLLGVPATGEPQAELWVGAHPAAPSRVELDGKPVSLAELIAGDPEATLGPGVRRRFGPRLPYLLKVLAVERPLSIQAHPTAAQAQAGYEAEEAAGVPRDAPHRSYRDRSPKPEMVVALTEFEALLGFRDPARTADLIDSLAVSALGDAAALLRYDGTDGLQALVRRWLLLPPDGAAHLARSVAEAARAARGELPRLVARLAELYPGDRGILLALLLRHERLAPGEAAFTPAGMPHAYLHGVAVEVQASSDNTLRAGLTGKHVDTDGLLRILRYEADAGARGSPRSARGTAWRCSRRRLRSSGCSGCGSTAAGPNCPVPVPGSCWSPTARPPSPRPGRTLRSAAAGRRSCRRRNARRRWTGEASRSWPRPAWTAQRPALARAAEAAEAAKAPRDTARTTGPPHRGGTWADKWGGRQEWLLAVEGRRSSPRCSRTWASP